MNSRICLIAFLIFSSSLHSQSKLVSDLPVDNLHLLDTIAGKYKVFFTGENHMFADENSNINLKMLKYLNEKTGVRNLILELGFSRGYMLNRYINGDTGYYDLLSNTTSLSYLEYYRELRKLNESLDSSRRITVHGVDVERFADDGPVLLYNLLPDSAEPPASISFSVEVIRSYGSYSMKGIRNTNYDFVTDDNIPYSYYSGFYDAKTIDTMIADYRLHRNDFMLYLGDSFALFDNVFTSIIEYRRYMNYAGMPHQYIYRERKMYENMTQLLTSNPSEKYYGQFGRCHVSRAHMDEACNWYAFSSIARRLNEGVAKDQVLSIGIFYNEKGVKSFLRFDRNFEKGIEEEIKKYKPEKCSNSNLLYKVADTDTALLRYYQYIIYNNNCAPGKDVEANVFLSSTTMDFGYGSATFDLKNLNAAIAPNLQGFSPDMMFYTLGFSVSSYGFYQNMSFRGYSGGKIINGPVTYNLKGYTILQGFGYMPNLSRRLALGLYVNYGFSRMSLNVQNDTSSVAISNGFSNVNQLKYINNGIVLGGGADLRFAITSWFGLFARTNYLVDVSNKRWRQPWGMGNTLDKSSPPTSVGSYSWCAGINFIIQD